VGRAADTWVVSERATWSSFWRYIVGIAACLLMGWYALVKGHRVPLLGLVDLGFHELGHLVTYIFPDAITAATGSITQMLVPFGLAVYFSLLRRDLLGGGLCLAWAGTSAHDVSLYIADAPFEGLQLIGGEHDWAFVLGPGHLDMLESAGTIATLVKGFGLMLLIAGAACCVAGIFARSFSGPTALDIDAPAASMWR
jgi:hypothetical protein